MQKLLAVLLLCWLASSGVRAAESGLFPSRTWDIRQFQASGIFPSPPFFAIAQSKDGLIYVGDNLGLLEFDGRTWRRLPIELNSAVTLIGSTRSGGLVVGGNEILMVFPDVRDLSRSIDVAAALEGGFHGSGEFWEIAEDDAQWCVRSTALLVCSDKDGFWKLRTKTGYGRIFSGRNSIYLQEDGVGLLRVGMRALKPMPGAEQFADIGIYSLTESPESNITAVTRTPQAIWRWNALESPGPPNMIDSSQPGNAHRYWHSIRNRQNYPA
ncbi:MAG: hypothetical protein IPK97_19720 [Ahniella sp.]|nr:hypothetical protein [Ahniella sp.]